MKWRTSVSLLVRKYGASSLMIQSSTLLIYQKEKFLQPWPMDRLPCYRYEKYHFWSADFNRDKQTASRLLKELWPGFTNQRSHVLPGDNSYKGVMGRANEETKKRTSNERHSDRLSESAIKLNEQANDWANGATTYRKLYWVYDRSSKWGKRQTSKSRAVQRLTIRTPTK